MFRRKASDQDPINSGEGDELGLSMKPARPMQPASTTMATTTAPKPLMPATPPRPVEAFRPETAAARPETARVAEMPRRFTETQTPAPAPAPKKETAELRTLIVGREIALSGEITSCDRLVVEGSVEANLANCRDIDIAESGLFKGSASIDEAEIRGRFEGILTVKKRLLIRSTGKVVGTVRYGQIEIERGGQLSGDVHSAPESESVADRPVLKEAQAG
jgi:cytoskeletal protein CcmA (bactofilin family)